MTQLLIGSLLLSSIHALIPNHWIPLVAIGRAQGWSRSETLVITGISGLAHVISTILIGVIVGLLGHRLSISHSTNCWFKVRAVSEDGGPSWVVWARCEEWQANRLNGGPFVP